MSRNIVPTRGAKGSKRNNRTRETAVRARQYNRERTTSCCVICGSADAGAVRVAYGVARMLCAACNHAEPLVPAVPEWMRLANCNGADPEEYGNVEFALTFCKGCPVLERCASWAWQTEATFEAAPGYPEGKRHSNTLLYYVYGGLLPEERKKVSSREEMVLRALKKVVLVESEDDDKTARRIAALRKARELRRANGVRARMSGSSVGEES